MHQDLTKLTEDSNNGNRVGRTDQTPKKKTDGPSPVVRKDVINKEGRQSGGNTYTKQTGIDYYSKNGLNAYM